MNSGRWAVARAAGPASELHAATTRPSPSVTWCDVSRSALILGSTQPDTVADADRTAAAGVDLVRRRSGGGAVLLVPGRVIWADVVIAPDDRWWDDDVGRAFHWLGRAWADVLRSLGVDGVAVHEERPVTSPWSRLACFAGLGAGEVTVGGRKVVGVSQRRTRDAALFQCACLLSSDTRMLTDLLALDDATRRGLHDELHRVSAGLDESIGAVVAPGTVEDAFLAALADR